MFIYLIVNVLLTLQFSYSLDGPHVCQKETTQYQQQNIPTKVPFEVKTYKWCAEIIPRCPTTRIEYRDSFTSKVKEVKVNVSVCCPGYAEFNERCIPMCLKCVHGICVEPSKCECEAGWSGDSCNISCPDGRSGNNCTSLCNCKNGATCDPVSGTCECKPGWTGKDCSKTCPKAFFGLGCSQKCTCLNEGACNHITGECKCRAGFKGEFCQDECGFNELDPECNKHCFCANDGACNVFTGECECQAGYTGARCEYPCAPGTYGYGCSQECNCPESECSNEFGCKLTRIPISIHSASFYRDEGVVSVNPILLTISCFLLLVVCLAFLALLKYRRRVKDLSKERAYVTYVANKDASDQFENPVYSFENPLGNKLRPLSQCKSNNLPTLTNDLSLSNNKWDKFQFSSGLEASNALHHPFHTASQPSHFHHHDHPRTSYDSGCSSSCRLNICDQASNLYANQEFSKSSDTLYKEPIYAEIKGKDLDDSNQASDHYDRPRPISKILNNNMSNNSSLEHI